MTTSTKSGTVKVERLPVNDEGALLGLITLNLFVMFKANIDLSLQYGVMVLIDGAALQFFELVLYGYLSMFFYLMFKTCERILVEGMVHPVASEPEARQAATSVTAPTD